MKDFRVVSLFSGCDGMDLGFVQEGFNIVWANDSDKSACATYRRNLGPILCADVKEVDFSTVPDCDVVVGGFPCQDFSIVGKRAGINGERGSLFYSFAEMIAAKRPIAFVGENVKGLISSDKGLAFNTIIETLENIAPGYIVKPCLYNFADFGVPPLRERVIIVGVRVDAKLRFVHPAPMFGPKAGPGYISAGTALHGVELVLANNERSDVSESVAALLSLIPEGGNIRCVPEGASSTWRQQYSNVYRRLDRRKPSYTVLGNGGGGSYGYHWIEPRPLTNRERARLQSFPDGFVFEGSSKQVRSQIGNAVPPLGARVIARELRGMLQENKPYDSAKELAGLKKLSPKELLNYCASEYLTLAK